MSDKVRAAAMDLDRAEQDRVGIPTLTSRPWDLTSDDAWDIATERDELRRNRGGHLVGYKLGWTSEAMRRALGIDRPNYGTLWDYMRAQDGEIDAGRLIHPKAEPEFAYVSDAALSGADVTPEEVLTAGRWAVAVEVVDPRWSSYEFDWLDNTADGSSAAGFALGPLHRITTAPEQLRLTMRAGSVIRDGVGAAAMGSPAVAVTYLLHQLHERGEGLTSGMVILTGGITAPVDVVSGLKIDVSSAELGSCRVRFA